MEKLNVDHNSDDYSGKEYGNDFRQATLALFTGAANFGIYQRMVAVAALFLVFQFVINRNLCLRNQS